MSIFGLAKKGFGMLKKKEKLLKQPVILQNE